MTALDLLPTFHPAYPALKADTRVFRVPMSVLFVKHLCSDKRLVDIPVVQASHNTRAGGACKKCNIAFVSEDT